MMKGLLKLDLNCDKIDVSSIKPVCIGERENDLSFLYEETLYYFIEQQSTYNPNMALRMFIYVAKALDTILEGAEIFGISLFPIREFKLATIFTGIVTKKSVKNKTSIISEQRLSDAYLTNKRNKKNKGMI